MKNDWLSCLYCKQHKLAGLVFRVTTGEEEAQEQTKEVTAIWEKLDISKAELRLTEQRVDEVEQLQVP